MFCSWWCLLFLRVLTMMRLVVVVFPVLCYGCCVLWGRKKPTRRMTVVRMYAHVRGETYSVFASIIHTGYDILRIRAFFCPFFFVLFRVLSFI